MASTYGVGKDNPADSYSLTHQQQMRAIYAMFDAEARTVHASYVHASYALMGPCALCECGPGSRA